LCVHFAPSLAPWHAQAVLFDQLTSWSSRAFDALRTQLRASTKDVFKDESHRHGSGTDKNCQYRNRYGYMFNFHAGTMSKRCTEQRLK